MNIPETAMEMVCVLWKFSMRAASDLNYRDIRGEYKGCQINGILGFKNDKVDIFFLCAPQLTMAHVHEISFGVCKERKI